MWNCWANFAHYIQDCYGRAEGGTSGTTEETFTLY